MKRLLLALAGYALYRWWTGAPNETRAAMLPAPDRNTRASAGNGNAGPRKGRKPA